MPDPNMAGADSGGAANAPAGGGGVQSGPGPSGGAKGSAGSPSSGGGVSSGPGPSGGAKGSAGSPSSGGGVQSGAGPSGGAKGSAAGGQQSGGVSNGPGPSGGAKGSAGTGGGGGGVSSGPGPSGGTKGSAAGGTQGSPTGLARDRGGTYNAQGQRVGAAPSGKGSASQPSQGAKLGPPPGKGSAKAASRGSPVGPAPARGAANRPSRQGYVGAPTVDRGNPAAPTDNFNDPRADFAASLPNMDTRRLADQMFGTTLMGPYQRDDAVLPPHFGLYDAPPQMAQGYTLDVQDPAYQRALARSSFVDPWGAGQPTTLGPTPSAINPGSYQGDINDPTNMMSYGRGPISGYNSGYTQGPNIITGQPGNVGGVQPGSGGYVDVSNEPTVNRRAMGDLPARPSAPGYHAGTGPDMPNTGGGQFAQGPPGPPSYRTGTGPDIAPGQMRGPQVVHNYGPGAPTAGGNTIQGPGYGRVNTGPVATRGPSRGDFQGNFSGNGGVRINPAGGEPTYDDIYGRGGFNDIMNPTPAPGYQGNPRQGDPNLRWQVQRQMFGPSTVPYRR